MKEEGEHDLSDNYSTSTQRSRMMEYKKQRDLDTTISSSSSCSSSEEEENSGSDNIKKINHIYHDVFYSEEDISRMKREVWLTDRDMTAVMTLMRKQFSDVGGLYDTLNGEFKQQFPAAEKSKWIQILYDGINHWLVAAYGFPFMPRDTVCIYDSKLKSGRPNPFVLSFCASLLKSQNKTIKIQTSSVQQQQRDDCGWYAIAFATALLYGKDPRKFCYEPRKFISYIKQSLTDKKFPRFRFRLIREFQLHATKKLQLS